MQGRDQVAHGFDDIRFQVAPADNAFLGQEVDENERPLSYRCDACHDRSFEFEHDRPRPDAFECQGDYWHLTTPLVADIGSVEAILRVALAWREACRTADGPSRSSLAHHWSAGELHVLREKVSPRLVVHFGLECVLVFEGGR